MRNVDCVSFTVPDLDVGIAQYTQGLGLREDVTEVVLVTHPVPAVQFWTDSVEAALPRLLAAGFTCRVAPFGIDIGRCAVLADEWGNDFCVLDMSKGRYSVDGGGNVTGVVRQAE